MIKKIVDYVGPALPFHIDGNLHAKLYPVNHPGPFVNNEEEVVTSVVLKWLPDGEIETLNTIYVPVRKPPLPWEKTTRGNKIRS